MTALPITGMTLFKHGVGYFVRTGRVDGERVDLAFPAEAMNDVLKSLTILDSGGGQVLGVEYPTPQTLEERLEGCTVRLGSETALYDLLVSLRGRRVQILLDQREYVVGQLVGVDRPPKRRPLGEGLVSVLLDSARQVSVTALGRVRGVEILDSRAGDDLRFFLDTSTTQETQHTLTVRLSAGAHDLAVSYVAPAPVWRVAYRLVVEGAEANAGKVGKEGKQGGNRALLLGWGIFDNSLEEDLTDVSLALVAGMPISFVYDLQTPHTPERPVVGEEDRVAAGPVEFRAPAGVRAMKAMRAPEAPAAAEMAFAAAAPMGRAVSADALAQATPLAVSSQDLGELFEYVIQTPISVGRGQSAMAPVVSAWLAARKELLYNGSKLARHPVATLRMSNNTGLTLERGPAVVLDNGAYAGEAVLPFTAAGGELAVPYAVELGARVSEESGARREVAALRITGHYASYDEWDIRWRDYRVNNSTGQPMTVLVEHRRTALYDLFDTADPVEQTPDFLRFAVETPAHGETTLRVSERRLVVRREEIRRLSSAALQGNLKSGLLDAKTYNRLASLLDLWSQIAGHEKRLAEIEKERGKVYTAQEQVRSNMQALSTEGKEGALRAGYVDKLAASEEQLASLATEEKQRQADIERLNREVDAGLAGLT
ncbi:MAG: hypothetical protein KDI03_11605 [Anaerolineae bacterium]|nr:hypothetical protein [Anaerolineae bacterium]